MGEGDLHNEIHQFIHHATWQKVIYVMMHIPKELVCLVLQNTNQYEYIH